MIPWQHDLSGERIAQRQPVEAWVAVDWRIGAERRRHFVIGAEEQHRFLGVLREDPDEPVAHFSHGGITVPELDRPAGIGGMPIGDGPFRLQRHNRDRPGLAPFLRQRVEKGGERPRRINRKAEVREPRGEREQAWLPLEVEQRGEAVAGRQHWLVAPGVVGICQRGKFPGESGGEGRPVAVRTRHGDRLERIRLVDQPEPDGLGFVRVMCGEHFGGVREAREFARGTGAGEPPAVAPQEHGARVRWP